MKTLDELNLPADLKYDADHEWVSAAAGRIGISDFAQDALGDLTFVELPETGAALTKGEEFGTLESTKSVSPLLSPVDGKVTAVNEALNDDPGLLNRDPYGDGWIIEVELSDPGQLSGLMDAAAYRKHLEETAE
ncbi:MAG: glycine cleavage system protein GcvH [Candidatus Adiutrix sp.]|jgi:glycine cleavage system H protein|nr:glycine cleavage system protein GcvH [Candidatus Adiutrix sp.]